MLAAYEASQSFQKVDQVKFQRQVKVKETLI